MNIESFMTRDVITVPTHASMLEASRLMKQRRIKHLPVMDGHGRVAGVVTDRDLKRASASDATTLEIHELLYLLDRIRMEEVMTRDVVTITPETSAQEAATLLVERGIGCLPVVHEGELVGIVTKDDLLRLLSQRGA